MSIFKKTKTSTGTMHVSTYQDLDISALTIEDTDGEVFAWRVIEAYPHGGWIAAATDTLREMGLKLTSAKLSTSTHSDTLNVVDYTLVMEG